MKTMSPSKQAAALEKYEAVGEETDRAGLSEKEKELTAVAISVAAGCRPCTSYHVDAVRKTGATFAETEHVLADALRLSGRAAAAMSKHASKRLVLSYGELETGAGRERGNEGGDEAERVWPLAPTEVLTPRVREIVAIGIAFAVNCTESLAEHLAAARSIGITDDEIKAVATLASFIKLMAASHVEKLVGSVALDKANSEPKSGGCGCS